MTSPDYPDFGTPQAHATAISTTGTPLLHGTDILDPHTTYTVAASGFQSPFYVVHKPGYLLQVVATCNAASTKPFMGVKLFWKTDSAGSNGIAQESWVIPASTAGLRSMLKGPVKGASFTLQLHNLDTVNSMTAVVDALDSTHHIARDDMRGDPCASVPTFTSAGGDPLNNILGDVIAGTIPASSFKSWLMPAYAGQVAINMFQSSPAVSLTTTLQAQGDVAGQPIIFWHGPDTNAIQGPFTINTPRCPTVLTITNNGTAACTINWAAVQVEFAS